MINFYRKFIHQAAKILHPLSSALKGSPKNFSWNSAMEQSFFDAKSAMLKVPRSVHSVLSAPISLVLAENLLVLGSAANSCLLHHSTISVSVGR